ncbi:MAG: nucleotidyltransferase family protein, partial [Candidatus Binatia bacterium]
MMRCLRTVEAMRLPDCYLAAGFLRNAIWDFLHEKPSRTPLNDVDVVYFDPGDATGASESGIETLLRANMPEVNWEVRNQARMHLKSGHERYRDSAHAVRHWPEIPTCVAIRIEADDLKIVAPYGLEVNWSLRVTPNPLVPYPAALYNDRIRSKHWLEHWPKLEVEWVRET